MLFTKSDTIKLISKQDKIFFVNDTQKSKIYMMNEVCWFILSNAENSSEEEITKVLIDNIVTKIEEIEVKKDVHSCIKYLIENDLLIIT